MDIQLGEPTVRFNVDGGRNIAAPHGTSFAAPHVSVAAAFALKSATATLSGGEASANAARALLGACAELPGCGLAWLLDPKGKESEEKLRLVGYGQVNFDRLVEALRNDVCILAADTLREDHWHLYSVTVPPSFIAEKGQRGISVALAFDPPVRLSRRDYLSRTMELEVLKGLTLEQIKRGRDNKAERERLKQSLQLGLFPPKTVVSRSTLQVRRRTWTKRPTFPTVDEENEPKIHILVECQSRFPSGLGDDQNYALAVRFWHSNPNVEIYQELQARVRPRAEVRVRVERRG